MTNRLVAAIAAAVLLAAAPAPPQPANYNSFGIALLQRTAARSRDNVFISPVSIGVALSMAGEGAAGATRAAMLQTLGQSGASSAARNEALLQSLGANVDAKVHVANALWLRQDIPPRPQYVRLLRSAYAAQAQALVFGNPSAAATINKWTSAHTLGLIDKIVDETSPEDFAYLTVAVSFDGKWTAPFDASETHSQRFTSAALLSHDVPMMHRTGAYATADFNRFRAVRLPYGNGGYAAYILLPDGDDPRTVLAQLSAAAFEKIASGLQRQTIALAVPKFTARYSTTLVPALRSMGMGIAFSNSADFSRMHAPPPHLFISSVRHAAYVRVDENGTVAAAATSVGIRMQSIMVPATRPFVVDHPFLFAIRDERTHNLLFIGVVRDV